MTLFEKKNRLSCNKSLSILCFDKVCMKRQVLQYIGKFKCISQYLSIDYYFF